MERIYERDFTVLETLYKTGNVEVFKAVITKNQKLIAVKKLYASSVEGLNRIYKEAIAMAKLKHPNIVNLRSCLFGETSQDQEYILFVMDYYPRGDLSREIHRRARHNNFWNEFELLEHMKSLIKTYKFLEENDVAHRDIKPNNIFVAEDNTLKVADLGSAANRNGLVKSVSMNLTIAGTRSYLSPLLLTAYIDLCNNRIGTGKVRHNPFKSDVYSLGLTFLYMASLQKVTRTDKIVNNSEEIVSIMVNQLNYSQNLKIILFQMLAYDEESRPDFIELDMTFSNLFNTQPAIAQQINKNIEEERKNLRQKARAFNVRQLLNNRKIMCKVYFRSKKAEDLISSSVKKTIDSKSFDILVGVIYILNSINCKYKIGKLTYICPICQKNNCEYITTCCNTPAHQACYMNICERVNMKYSQYQGFTCIFCQKFILNNRENFHSMDYTRYISLNPDNIPLYETEKVREINIFENNNQQSQNDRRESFPKLEILTSLCFSCKAKNITVVSFSCGHKFCKECFSTKIKKCRKEICFSCPKEYNNEELLAILYRLKWDVNIS